MTYLDTHVVVWLYAGEIERFPSKVLKILENSELYISPVVLLEIKYLNEIRRIKAEPTLIFENLASATDLKMCTLPFIRVITEALGQTWTRDPFDRIITGTAHSQKSPLVTKDKTILKNYSKAVWN